MRYANNPGNLRYSERNHWIGQLHPVKGFCTFSTMNHGLRALCMTLISYRNKHGLSTVKEIISRYAPPSENSTDAYISFVCSQARIQPYSSIFDSVDVFCRVVSAICYMETSYVLQQLQVRYIEDIYNSYIP